jgi:predicted enzyme related to lactoylglutathione lyase
MAAIEIGEIEVGIVVGDLDAVTPFYRDGVGLSELGDIRTGLGRLRRFACGKSVIALQELDKGPTSHNLPGGAPAGSTGMRWLVIRVDDINEVFERCKSVGGRVINPPRDFPGDVQLAIVEDPEGNCYVELVSQ